MSLTVTCTRPQWGGPSAPRTGIEGLARASGTCTAHGANGLPHPESARKYKRYLTLAASGGGFVMGAGFPGALHRSQRRRGPLKLLVVKHVNFTPHSGQLVSQSMTAMFDPSGLACMRDWTGR
jgi:hypothetical protein